MGAGELASFFCAKLDPTKDLYLIKIYSTTYLGWKGEKEVLFNSTCSGSTLSSYGV